ncbi:Hypothetical predicted protein, partial [Pelobates cultripes]
MTAGETRISSQPRSPSLPVGMILAYESDFQRLEKETHTAQGPFPHRDKMANTHAEGD